MATFHDVQTTLDRILGTASPGNHRAFWRGKTRDEFVAHEVFGLKIIEVGAPEKSNLALALKGRPPFGADLTPRPPGALLPRMPAGQPPAVAADIELIEQWIKDGCPDERASDGIARTEGAAALAGAVDDDTHVRYWREVDHFFHPTTSSPETNAHVGQLLSPALFAWVESNVQGGSADVWRDYMARADVKTSFDYIRLHQQRLIQDHYGTSQDNLFDSLWKFGGDLLPRDPNSDVLPEHRMNSVRDWFFWVPYVDMSLRSATRTDADVQLARAWQVGIAADGLLRRDVQRPQPMPIPEFDENDPNVRTVVVDAYANASVDDLISGMQRRARDFFAP
jgi:hypothetical protein